MISVFVLIDALGWGLLDNREFLNDLFPYRTELKTVFGFSSAAIPSILTGLLPREHGHWNLFVYDPERSPFRWARFLSALPSPLINSRVARRAVSIIGRKVSRTDGYFQIYGVPVEILPFFDVCEKNNIYRPGGLFPNQSIFDCLEERQIAYKVYSYHQYRDQQAVGQVVRDVNQGVAQFYFVYLSELDAFLHFNIADSGRVTQQLECYAAAVRKIYEASVATDPEAGFYIFSDHGMTPVTGTFDLMGSVAELGFSVPADYVALYDSTMARFWFFRDAARRAISSRLGELACGSIITPAEQRAFGIDFPHNRFGDLIFLMKPGCLMHPSHMGRVPWPGMHGFHPDHVSSSAALLARKEPPAPVRGVWDVFALMRLEAGIG